MENERRSGDVLGAVSEEMARQILCDLLSIQAARARMMLESERRDSRVVQRILVTTLATVLVTAALAQTWL